MVESPGNVTPDARLLPAFPLGTVLVPGLVLPLHIFEQRYRDLVGDLMDLPEERREFVVVAIRSGREVGTDGVRALYDVGTIASLRDVTPLADGRFDVVCVGTSRVRIGDLDHQRSYLQAQVTELAEHPGDDPAIIAEQVRQAFAEYRSMFSDADPSSDDLPDDPGVLSYLITAALVVDLPDRQAFLEAPDDSTRLRWQLRRLRQEISLMRVLPSLPAVDLASTRVSSN